MGKTTADVLVYTLARDSLIVMLIRMPEGTLKNTNSVSVDLGAGLGFCF